MANQLTLIFCILVVSIITKAAQDCNGTLHIKNSDTLNPELIKSGSLAASNNVFIFTISKDPKNKITFTLDKPSYVTGIGIRQRFNEEEVGDECKSSFFQDPLTSYLITYTGSRTDNRHKLDYPPGVRTGIINVNTLLPYQEIPIDMIDKKNLKIAIIPTIMWTITIEKMIFGEDNQIYNSGTFCLQFELYGCNSTQHESIKPHLILEYQMYLPIPLPDSTVSSDSTYTGICSEGTCTGGTGKLTDGDIVVISPYDTDLFVLWKLKAPIISVGDSNLKVMRMLLILNGTYFIKEIQIYGSVKVDSLTFTPPSFVTVNGITVKTSDTVRKSGLYAIHLFPNIITNAITFHFYVNAVNNASQYIALSEISIEGSYSESECEEEQSHQTNIILIAVVSPIAIILLALLTISTVLNVYFIIIKKKKKPENKYYLERQLSQINDYTRTFSTDIPLERIDTNYESIDFSASNTNQGNKIISTEQESVEDREQIDRANSILIMPLNPTYVSTLPLSPIEEVPGYSHLIHDMEQEKTGHSTVEKSNTLPRLKSKSSSPVFTAAERRRSYSEQHDLSDLK